MTDAITEAQPTIALALGQPRFESPSLQSLQATQGNAAVWAALLTGDAAAALATVKGTFAVHAHWPDGRALVAVDRFAAQSLCYREAGGQLQVAARADAWAGARKSTRRRSTTTCTCT